MNEGKIFILVPNSHRTGGLANYFRILKRYLKRPFEYIRRGEKIRNESKINIPFRIICDYIKFCRKTWHRIDTLFINSSLGMGGFFRDGIYSLLTFRDVSQIIFFHGWDLKFEKKIDNNLLFRFWLNQTFLKADHIIVLSSQFKAKLREWGYTKPISIETTLVEEKLIDNHSWESIEKYRDQLPVPGILYLSGMIKAKGVWEIAEALKILDGSGNLDNVDVTMAGDGTERRALESYMSEHNLDVDFPGYVINKDKTNAFLRASIFIFASHTEGMPLAVLEAMAFGLPVITTRVGGIPDFFEDGKMGILLENNKPDHIAEKIKYLVNHPGIRKKMSEYNYNYAKEHFYVSKVAARIDNILDSVKGRGKPGIYETTDIPQNIE